MNKHFAGFTLIELLVVIAIIGILSSVVLTNLNSARTKARDAKRITDVKQLQLALELYYDVNRVYPATLASGGASELAPTFIPTIPTPPSGSGQAVYRYSPLSVGGSGLCNGYHLGAVLEQNTNSVLTNDSDESGGTMGSGCGGGGTAVADFVGLSTDCINTAGTDACFDVTP